MSDQEKGFTLIETILYIGLLVMIFVFLVGFFQQSVFLKGKVNERLDNMENAQYAFNRISWYLQNSLAVNQPQPGQISDTISVDSLVSDKNPLTFFNENGILKMQAGSDAPINLTNERLTVEEISFSNSAFPNQPAIIQIKMQVSGNNPFWQTQGISLQTSVKLEK